MSTSAASNATIEIANQLGISTEEYHVIAERLGRPANFTELCIFSVMWSEHCSYKNSIKWLKTLPRDGAKMLVKAGEENAGVVDIGDGVGCVFKIESHNHPSAIEPYQGAATGVGGIHRDIFTMGARPIVALNSLRFGKLSDPKTKHLLKGVVKGIGDYGNCFGVPTVGGEVFFDEVYQTNPLVNAMSVGVIDVNKIISATAEGVGNPVFIVGSATGKDGIGGASFASKDISEDSAKDLPAVQVGDPFQEKLLLEATLELSETGAIVGMQDMGAAGITCSTSEMSAKGGVGMNVWLHKVPTRQADMKPFEILLSESQERMLIVVEKGKEADVMKIFDKWDLHCVQIGEVIEEQILNYYMHDELVAKVTPHDLVLGGGAPVYERAYSEPKYFSEFKKFDINFIAEPSDIVATAKQMLGLPNLASKRWVYNQYDSMVGVNNISTNTPTDAAISRIVGTERAVASTVDCNARYVSADPYKGAMIAVSEAARNIVCSGGEPSAITNCLNFGNPHNPEVYWQFVNAIQGMGEACRKFDTPVTGGNVSFYNQSEDGPVFPTPTIGMVGVISKLENITSLSYKQVNDIIYLIGQTKNDISSSEYLVNICGVRESSAPHFDINEEHLLQQTIKSLIQYKMIHSAHDVSDGGLFTNLVESGMHRGLGFEITADTSIRKDAFLFGESQSRVVVSINPSQKESFEKMMSASGQVFSLLGKVSDGNLKVDDTVFGNIAEYKHIFDNAIGDEMV
jgi:phosphoribosylformylglycinamidine synthase subunit PurL